MAFTPVRERGALGKLGHILQMSDPRYGALYAEQAQDYERQQGLAALRSSTQSSRPSRSLVTLGLLVRRTWRRRAWAVLTRHPSASGTDTTR